MTLFSSIYLAESLERWRDSELKRCYEHPTTRLKSQACGQCWPSLNSKHWANRTSLDAPHTGKEPWKLSRPNFSVYVNAYCNRMNEKGRRWKQTGRSYNMHSGTNYQLARFSLLYICYFQYVKPDAVNSERPGSKVGALSIHYSLWIYAVLLNYANLNYVNFIRGF